jgi:hypothetical protein
MTQGIAVPSAARVDPAASSIAGTTRRLLVCGIVAGPLFVVVVALQVLLRDGFDLSRHPISLLSLGSAGWVQIANFVVSGALALAAAVGLRRALGEGPRTTWGPRLIGVYGVGLIAGGVFLADPAFGFPPGTPPGMPDEFSWHGIVHAVAPPLAFLALLVACFVFARRFAALGRRGWVAYSFGTALVVIALLAVPGQDGASVALAAATVPAWAWLSALSASTMASTARPAVR